MTDSKRLTFFEKLAELLKLAPEKEVFETLNRAIEAKLQSIATSEKDTIDEVRTMVEREYGLKQGQLNNCFTNKKPHLSEPKKMWVLISYALLKDQKIIVRYIQNGITRNHVFRYKSEFVQMNDNIKHHKEFKERFNKIIENYGNTVL